MVATIHERPFKNKPRRDRRKENAAKTGAPGPVPPMAEKVKGLSA
jgi:hypothetical protein